MINFLLPLVTNAKMIGVVVALTAASFFSYKLASNLKQLEIEKISREYEVYKSTSEKKRAELIARNSELEATAAKETVKVITKYVDRIKTVELKGEEIIREIPIYISKESDANCTIPLGFVRMHDAATATTSSGEKVSIAPGTSNERATDIELSEVAKTVTGNYTSCNKVREQLTALQEWVRTQEKTFNSKEPSN